MSLVQKKMTWTQKEYIIRKHEEEVRKEREVLLRIEELAPELIRLIYDYMSGNAKLVCHKKLDSICEVISCNKQFVFIDHLRNLLEEATKKSVLDFIFLGPLRNHPDIINALCFHGYYSRLRQSFVTVKGYHLLHLWESDRLEYNFLSRQYIPTNTHITYYIKRILAYTIYDYIVSTIRKYEKKKDNYIWNHGGIFRMLSTDIQPKHREMHLHIDSVFYLYHSICFLGFLP
jgi:hypothetical protein